MITKEEFIKFYQGTYNHTYVHANIDIAKWYDKWEASHQDLINKFGGLEISVPISGIIDRGTEVALDCALYNLNHYIKEYLADTGLSIDDIRNSELIPRGNFQGTKWLKSILRYADSPENFLKYSHAWKRDVEYYFSKIARCRAALVPGVYNLNISVDPRSFPLLGHYSTDGASSCFRDGGMNDAHKYMIGQTKNTFVLTISTKTSTLEKSCICRCWGRFRDDLATIDTCNWYPKPEPFEAYKNIEQILPDLSKLFGIEYKVYRNKFRVVGWVYDNLASHFTFSDTEPEYAPLIVDMSDLMELQKCCGYMNYAWPDMKKVGKLVYSNGYISSYYRKTITTCDYTGEEVFETIDAILPDGSRGKIYSALVDSGDFVYPVGHETCYHISLCEMDNNGKWVLLQQPEPVLA